MQFSYHDLSFIHKVKAMPSIIINLTINDSRFSYYLCVLNHYLSNLLNIMHKIICGTDIVEIKRVKKLVDRRKHSSLLNIFTQKEIDYCASSKLNYAEKYAGRFAAKEAVLKLFGIGLFDGVPLNTIEILNKNSGKPYLSLYNEAKGLYISRGILDIDLSISHTSENAIAFTVAIFSE